MNKMTTKLWKSLLSIILIFSFAGCGEMLDDPTIDKNTGEDINLIIVDFNFFNTRMTFKLIDVADQSAITNQAKIWFTGTNANDIVTFAGEKEAEHFSSLGQIELTVDPNVKFTASSPLDFTIHVEIDGYQAFSQNIIINNEGKKTFELYMAKTTGGEEETLDGEEDDDSFIFMLPPTKSAAIDNNFRINYRITKEDILKFTDFYGQKLFSSLEEMMAAYNADKAHFLKLTVNKNSGFPATTQKVIVDGTTKTVLLNKLEVGNLKELVIGGRRVVGMNGAIIKQVATYTGTTQPEIFGFAQLEGSAWDISETTIMHSSLNFTYTLAQASGDALCGNGIELNFTSNSRSSFSIDADIYDANGNYIKSTNFKGDFPEPIILENVPAGSGKIVFRDNNPAFLPISELSVSDFCSGSYEVEVTAETNVTEYQIVLKALCPDDPTIAVAPTYNGEYRIKGSNDAWQGVDMNGGVANILAQPNKDYQLRLQWENDWETSDFSTKFDANGNYQGTSASKITSKKLADGRIQILIEHTFDQSVCDDLGW